MDLASSAEAHAGRWGTVQDAVERVLWELKADALVGEDSEDDDAPTIVVTMGAGDITCLGERLLQRLDGRIEFLD